MTRDEPLRDALVQLIANAAVHRETLEHQLAADTSLHVSASDIHARLSTLLQFDTSFSELGDRVIYVPALLDGTTWTVWVDEADAAQGLFRSHPQLSPLIWWLIQSDVDLADESGAVIGQLEPDGIWLDGIDTDVIIGPHGWLDDLAGGWASVAVSGSSLCWTALAEPPEPSRRQIDALRVGFDRTARTESKELFDAETVELRYASGDTPMLEAVVADRDAFIVDSVPPLPALLRAAGLDERKHVIAEEGFDWDSLDAWRRRNRLGIEHDLEPHQVDRLMIVVGACETYAIEGPTGLGPTDEELEGAALLLTAILEDSAVAASFWDECDSRGVVVADIGRFVDELVTNLGGDVMSGVGWVQSRVLDLAGNAIEAADLLAQLADAECKHVPLLLDAAAFASDRGDAVGAFRLLRQAGFIDDLQSGNSDEDEAGVGEDEADLLWREFGSFALHRPPALAGRNDRCPCGSGRKYKACHLGRERHELADRSAWLFDKAKRFVRQRRQDDVFELAGLMAADDHRMYAQLADSPFVMDLALHEGGLFAEFLAARNGLLPDDEVLLASQWELVDRGVFEVQRVIGDRLELHDVGRGEDITVVNTHGSDQTRVGTLMVGRPVPVGDTYRAFSGFLKVDRASVAAILDAVESGDAEEIAAAIAAMLGPPRLQNTDGHDLELHTIRWRVPDTAGMADALRTAGLQQRSDGASWWLGRTADDAPETILASLRFADDHLIGDVNSSVRAAVLRDLVTQALPDAQLIDDVVVAVDEAQALAATSKPAGPASDDPALKAMMATFIADAERRWLDESIPALGGRTPREAAKDAIGREQLRQLLAAFPDLDDNVGVMSPRRLSAALGL